MPDTPTEGVHFERLLSIIDPYEASALLDSMEQGVLRFLRAKPISGLFFVDAIAGSPAYGRLSWRTDPATMAKYGFILQVSGGRPIQSYGDAMVPGSSWSMSSAGATKQAAMERTFTHELGHHVHLNGGKQVDTLVRRAYRLTMKENRAITLYAMTNPLEYFAETFTAYRYEPTLLKARDPRGYRMVRRIRKLTGVDQ